MKYIFSLILILSFEAAAQGSRTSSKKPWLLSTASEAAEAKRFTLAEWFEKKQKASLGDMWMGYNTNVYEFMFGLVYHQYDYLQKAANVNTVDTAYNNYQGDFAAYVKNVGLSVQYQQNREEKFDDTTGMFNFRILGTSMQNSHLTFHYGLRTRVSNANNYRMNHQFPAVTLQLYLVSSFGINGHYRKYLLSSEAINGDTEGTDLTAGVFIEYGSLRISGSYFEEAQSSKLNGITTDVNRRGTKVGLQFFF